MSDKRWPPPGFPLVEGEQRITATWTIQLPEQFARRIEGESLVLWRPGLTLWIAAWGSNHLQSRAERLNQVRSFASKDRFDEREEATGRMTRFSYRLKEQCEALYAFILGECDQVEIGAYFDDPADEHTARQLVDSVREMDVS